MSIQSEQIDRLAKALADAQGEMQAATKGVENTFFKSSYADLAAVMAACRGPLSKHGLAVIQTPQYEGDAVWLETTLAHASGQFIRSRYPVRPQKLDPQGFGSALTYARRYALAAMVGVVAENEDDDGNAASGHANGNGHARAEPPKRAVASPPNTEGVKWANAAEEALRLIQTRTKLESWEEKNKDGMNKLKAIDSGLYQRVQDAIQEVEQRITEAVLTA